MLGLKDDMKLNTLSVLISFVLSLIILVVGTQIAFGEIQTGPILTSLIIFLPAFIIIFAIIYLASSNILKKYKDTKIIQAILKPKGSATIRAGRLPQENGNQNYKKFDYDESPSSWAYRVIIVLVFLILACVLIVLYFTGYVKQIQPPQYYK